MGWLKTSLSAGVAIVVSSGLAMAQTTGTISGRVVDAQNLSVPGVTVNATSPNLQGIQSVVTSGNGDYILPQLPAGPYEITYQLSGFQQQKRTLNLSVGQTLSIDVTMGPAALTETVNVVGSTTTVLTETAQVATNFNQDLIALLPTNRTIDASILRAPAVHPTGPNGAYSIAGAMSFESLYMVNGVTVNENLRGQPFNLYIEDAIQETTVSTSGISAEYGRFSGGVVNVITKSGTNLFAGSFRDTLYNDNWRAYNVGNAGNPWTTDCPTCAAGGTPTRVDKVVPQYEYVFGGPIVRDKLTFFTAGRFINQQFSRSTIAPLNIPYTAENNRKRYEIKLTGSLNADHRLDGSYTKETLNQTNDTFQVTTSMDLASLYNRQTPQDLFTMTYRGVLSRELFIEGRFSQRHFSFIGSGAPFTDLIKGTLLLDRQRVGRYWAPTFCGVCDNEKRDNDEEYAKGTYFLSTKNGGSHTMVFGYDRFNDKRFANNHQSGSDYRINGTTSIIRGGVIYPQWLPGSSTVLQYNPILVGSLGSNFRTHSVFFNDNWHWTNRVTLNLGLRWDKNQGANGQGDAVVKDSAFSPRFGVVWDPTGNGRWSLSGSIGQYTAAVSTGIADGSSAGGNSATFQYQYSGPAINPDATAATLIDSPTAIAQMFAWCNRDSAGLCQRPIANSTIPGVSLKIADSLKSPNVIEYAGGISRQFGSRAAVRADYAYRNYRDFYAAQIDLATGTVVDPFGNKADLEIDQNSNVLKRRYSGLTLSANYRVGGRTDIGGNYTLSRLWGNFNGENTGSGPVTSDALSYPEYHVDSWFLPIGDLESDQRHRASMWINYGVPRVNGLSVSLLEDLASGQPYGANGTVDARTYVPASIASKYASPQGGTNERYFYTARDAFRTEAARRTDLAVNYDYGFGAGGGRTIRTFIQAQVINLFNEQALCGCGAADVFGNGGAFTITRIGTSVLSPANTAALTRFDPFNATPVQGPNWNYGTNFGTPLNRQAFTTPRTFRLTFGVRF